MDARQYGAYKDENAVEIKRAGKGAYQAVVKQHDIRNGAELPSITIPLDLDTLESQEKAIEESIDELQDDLKSVRSMKEDLIKVATEGGDDLDQIRRDARRSKRAMNRASGGPR